MQIVPAKSLIPRSSSLRGWRTLIMLFAGLLALGLLLPFTAAASTRTASPAHLQVKDRTVVEGDSGTKDAKVRIVLSHPVNHKVSVAYRTRHGTATAGSDYVARHGRVHFHAGTTVAVVRVPVIGDTVDEPDQYFKVRIFDAFRAHIEDPVGIVTIIDNDGPSPSHLELSIDDTHATEGNDEVFTVSLDETSTSSVSVFWETANGTAKAPDDYAADHGTLTIPAGHLVEQVTVSTVDDSLSEGDQTFFVNLSHPQGATVHDGHGVATILDNDPEQPNLAIDDATVTEGSHAVLTVKLSAASGKTVSVFWATADGTATKPGDYTADHGTLTFAPGDTTKQITVATVTDTTTEPAEDFSVELSNPVNATINQFHAKGTVTISANST